MAELILFRHTVQRRNQISSRLLKLAFAINSRHSFQCLQKLRTRIPRIQIRNVPKLKVKLWACCPENNTAIITMRQICCCPNLSLENMSTVELIKRVFSSLQTSREGSMFTNANTGMFCPPKQGPENSVSRRSSPSTGFC